MELWKNLKELKGRICVIDVGKSFIEPEIGLIIVGYRSDGFDKALDGSDGVRDGSDGTRRIALRIKIAKRFVLARTSCFIFPLSGFQNTWKKNQYASNSPCMSFTALFWWISKTTRLLGFGQQPPGLPSFSAFKNSS